MPWTNVIANIFCKYLNWSHLYDHWIWLILKTEVNAKCHHANRPHKRISRKSCTLRGKSCIKGAWTKKNIYEWVIFTPTHGATKEEEEEEEEWATARVRGGVGGDEGVSLSTLKMYFISSFQFSMSSGVQAAFPPVQQLRRGDSSQWSQFMQASESNILKVLKTQLQVIKNDVSPQHSNILSQRKTLFDANLNTVQFCLPEFLFYIKIIFSTDNLSIIEERNWSLEG